MMALRLALTGIAAATVALGVGVSSNGADSAVRHTCSTNPNRWDLTTQQVDRLVAAAERESNSVLRITLPRSRSRGQISVAGPSVGFDDNAPFADGISIEFLSRGDPDDPQLCAASGTDATGQKFRLPLRSVGASGRGSEGRAGQRLFLLPKHRPASLAITYSDVSREKSPTAGRSCREPYVAFYNFGSHATGRHFEGSIAVRFREAAGPEPYDLTFSWAIKPGYRFCETVIAADGVPVFRTTTRAHGSHTVAARAYGMARAILSAHVAVAKK